jgi:hypothetical protein
MPRQPRNTRNPSNNNRPRPRNSRRQLQIPREIMRRADQAIHTIPCTCEITMPYIPLTGFNGAGTNICFATAQAGLLWSVNGSSWNTSNFQNFASMANVFQEYRIRQFSIEVFCSINSVNAPTSISSGQYMPMLYSCVDREDAIGVSTSNQALQFASCQVTQMGSTQGSKTTICVGPAAFGAYDNAGSFLGTVVATGAARSPWLSCGTNNANAVAALVPHGYIKYVANNFGSTLSVTLCTLTFVCRAHVEYRGID